MPDCKLDLKRLYVLKFLRSASIEFYLRVSDEEIFLKKMSSPSVPYVVIFLHELARQFIAFRSLAIFKANGMYERTNCTMRTDGHESHVEVK